MSEPKHTPGLLQVGRQRPHYIFPAGELQKKGEHGLYDVYALAEALPRSTPWPSEYPAEANAARLVACWNALAGIANPEAVPEILGLVQKLVERMGPLDEQDVRDGIYLREWLDLEQANKKLKHLPTQTISIKE